MGVILWILIAGSCSKDGATDITNESMTLSSTCIGADSLLPAKYTCDGESATLPVAWKNAPAGTVSYALTMHHVASPEDVHWYWILYNIPASVMGLPENTEGIGSLGTNSVNDRNEYAPPCSQGPGIKAYTFFIFALSEELNITAPPESIDLDFIRNVMQDKIISQATMTVYYSRSTK